MKKLKLKTIDLGTKKVLTRAELKNVQGGLRGESCTENSDCGTHQCSYLGNPEGNTGTCR